MGFSFQGIHSKEKKLKARITGYPMLPAFRNNTESIPGRSGILDFGMEYSDHWTYNLDLILDYLSVFPEQDFSALVHRIDEINGWLNPYRGVQPLIFDEYPDRYFMARLNTEISMERVSRAAGTFSLEFICPNPFGYAVEDEVFSIAAEGKTTVNRQKGNLISEPIFELKAVMDSTSSYVDIEVNGELVRVKGKLAEGETFVLDTAKLTAKVVDSNTRETLRNGLSQLDELVFPELNPGGNEVLVSVSGAAFTELTIQGRSRWV